MSRLTLRVLGIQGLGDLRPGEQRHVLLRRLHRLHHGLGYMAKLQNRDIRDVAESGEKELRPDTNSKHWFTTSLLQPLPYLVTP